LVQPGSYTKAAWPNPTLGPFGLVLEKLHPAHDESFTEIVARLRQSLHGVTAVFTHNPWGEYGHEEHALVYAAVNSLKEECGFDLYVSPYVGSVMLGLCREVVDRGIDDAVRFKIDPAVTAKLTELYANIMFGHGFTPGIGRVKRAFSDWAEVIASPRDL